MAGYSADPELDDDLHRTPVDEDGETRPGETTTGPDPTDHAAGLDRPRGRTRPTGSGTPYPRTRSSSRPRRTSRSGCPAAASGSRPATTASTGHAPSRRS